MRCALAIAVMLAGSVSAIDPKDEAFIGKRRNWWSFQKPVQAEVPAGAANPVDAFLLRAMRAKDLTPSPPLPKTQLIRRITLDLTGLPPTPAEVDRFLRDNSPKAYEHLVDRLMASPAYGERWAQRWLDVVRYADTNGYELDLVRPHAWRYRDYVVASFNADKPYDRFLKEQLAGDELYPGDSNALIATGFHRAGPAHLVGGNQDEEMNRQEVLTEFASGVGQVFLGLTVGCAKCHNHKFDPILQADYYRLQAIFGSTEGRDVDISTPEQRAAYEKAKAEYKARLKPVEEAIAAIEKPYREKLKADKKAQLEPQLREALDIPKEKRTPDQEKLAKAAQAQVNASWDEVLAIIPPGEKAQRAQLRKKLHEIELTEPEPPPIAYAVHNNGTPETTHILRIGDPKNKIAPVGPGFPTVLAPDNGRVTEDGCGRRAALAEWLASKDHPLTARVMVNRIWQFRMGAGLVRTPNDFGALGERPTNPALLDWLAVEFMHGGWSIKQIDRLIVTSATYRQQSDEDEAKSKIDPENKLYWRAHRKRLEAEQLRDSVLGVSGKLNPQMGGRPVRTPIEPEIYDVIFTEAEPDNLWPLSPDPSQQYRRSLYVLNKRTVRLPMMVNFDQPDNMTSCPVRPVSTHALQALSMLNSSFLQEQASAFATRVEQMCSSVNCRVDKAYRLALARPPRPQELTMARAFLARNLFADFCLALLNRNEFVYVP